MITRYAPILLPLTKSDTAGEAPMIGLTTADSKKRHEKISPLRLMEASAEAGFSRMFDCASSIKNDEEPVNFGEGCPHRSLTSQGLAPITTSRPWQSSASALPIVTTKTMIDSTLTTTAIRFIVRELPGPGIDVPRYPRQRRPRRLVCGGC